MTLLESLVSELLYKHPLPWSIEHDWLVEVYDTHQKLVIKLMTDSDARELTNIAERLVIESASAAIEFEEMMNANTTD